MASQMNVVLIVFAKTEQAGLTITPCPASLRIAFPTKEKEPNIDKGRYPNAVSIGRNHGSITRKTKGPQRPSQARPRHN